MQHHAIGAGIGILLILFFIALGLLAFVFWIWMLVDAIKNPGLSGTERIVWVLVIVFLHFLGALIYFFAGRRR
jgi:phospholipase D-like protein